MFRMKRGGGIFAIGGFDDLYLESADAEIFDPVMGDWTATVSMPHRGTINGIVNGIPAPFDEPTVLNGGLHPGSGSPGRVHPIIGSQNFQLLDYVAYSEKDDAFFCISGFNPPANLFQVPVNTFRGVRFNPGLPAQANARDTSPGHDADIGDFADSIPEGNNCD
jgi:hypothetical protein